MLKCYVAGVMNLFAFELMLWRIVYIGNKRSEDISLNLFIWAVLKLNIKIYTFFAGSLFIQLLYVQFIYFLFFSAFYLHTVKSFKVKSHYTVHQLQEFTHRLKWSVVKSLHKKGDKTLISNHRPVSHLMN
jgi:hypothetical protein